MNVFIRGLAALLIVTAGASAQAPAPNDPFPAPIAVTEGIIRVNVAEFASIPDIDGVAARMMNLAAEPGTPRLFVNDMRGQLYRVSEDGTTVTKYLDINANGIPVQAAGRERGFQTFAFHPEFNQSRARGFGKFYTYLDTSDMTPPPDFVPAPGAQTRPTHDTVLLEWTAKTPRAETYDGGPPRELLRWRQPYANHNGGLLAFNPNAAPGAADFALLYVGVADGGSGGDPLGMAQNPASAFGKILRIDPSGTNSRNKKYGIPASNPFVRSAGTLPEIYALGLRNPQRVAWDPRNGSMFVSDIGQNVVEEISPVMPGANLGWNRWEGSFRYVSRQGVSLDGRRSDPAMTYPVVEWDQLDPLLQAQGAAGGLAVYRGAQIPQLANLLLFADMPSGEMFYVTADKLPAGGQDRIRRVLFNSGGTAKTFLELIRDRNMAQRRRAATRADLRINLGPANQIFLLNKGDGTIRVVRP